MSHSRSLFVRSSNVHKTLKTTLPQSSPFASAAAACAGTHYLAVINIPAFTLCRSALNTTLPYTPNASSSDDALDFFREGAVAKSTSG